MILHNKQHFQNDPPEPPICLFIGATVTLMSGKEYLPSIQLLTDK